jgi:hypothetical protein
MVNEQCSCGLGHTAPRRVNTQHSTFNSQFTGHKGWTGKGLPTPIVKFDTAEKNKVKEEKSKHSKLIQSQDQQTKSPPET